MIPSKGWAGTKGAHLVSFSLYLSEKIRFCLPGPSPPSHTPAPARRQHSLLDAFHPAMLPIRAA